jgi:RNA 2',3'-cyclic 3'-phosphodiesterase
MPEGAAKEVCYFAILPDAATADRIAEIGRRLRRRHGFKGSVKPPHLLHISLQGLSAFGGLTETFVAAVDEAVARVCVGAFDLTLDRSASWGRLPPHPFVLSSSDGDSPVRSLRGGLATRVLGLDPPLPQYAPHLTLLYDDAVAPEVELEEPITFAVRDIVLVRSHFGQGRHEHLRRWALPQ